MTTPDLKDLEEVWASTTGGTVWIWKTDPQNPRNHVQKMIGGPGNVKLKVTVAEREFNEDLIAWGNEDLCPFRNGLLVRVLPKDAERGQFERTDEELKALIQSGTDEVFKDLVDHTDSEVIIRRMLALAAADKSTSIGRLEILIDLIKERYPQGRGSKFVDEIHEHEQKMRSLSRL